MYEHSNIKGQTTMTTRWFFGGALALQEGAFHVLLVISFNECSWVRCSWVELSQGLNVWVELSTRTKPGWTKHRGLSFTDNKYVSAYRIPVKNRLKIVAC
jgi:hypothetical protein